MQLHHTSLRKRLIYAPSDAPAPAQPRLGRMIVADTASSAPLATFDYEVVSGGSVAFEAGVLRNTLTWVWNTIPAVMDYARHFSFYIEEALHPQRPGDDPEYVALYARERMTASELFELVDRQRKKMDYMTLTTERPKYALTRGFMFEPA
jgi:hypothetical protein